MSKKLPDTSHAANKAATLEMRKLHYGKIISALKKLGSGTYEEIALFAGLEKHQVGRRLSEIEGDLVWKPGLKKLTSSGRNAFVYQLTGESQPKTQKSQSELLKETKTISEYAGNIARLAKESKAMQLGIF